MTTYRYRPEIAAALPRYGVRLLPHTRPELVREFVADLYRFELRALRDRLLRREFPKPEYAARVTLLRDKYGILMWRAREWAAPTFDDGVSQRGREAGE
jgi:hypothetical protein